MYVIRDFPQLAHLISGQDFDHVFTVSLTRSVEDAPAGFYAPEVTNDPNGDITVWSEDWHALTGYTGQHGYSGAAMHASESVGSNMAMDIAHMSDEAYEQGRRLAWTMVAVESDTDDDAPVGWAILWRYIPTVEEIRAQG